MTTRTTAIVAAVVGLTHTMGLVTVAEGIEESPQADELRELGCPQGQGYLYAKPLTSVDFEALLLQRPQTASAPRQRNLHD